VTPQQPAFSSKPPAQPALAAGGGLGGLSSIGTLDFDVGGTKNQASAGDAYIPSFGGGERRQRRAR